MRFTFTVSVEVQRDEGKFASRDDVAQEIRDALEGADPGSMSVGENGQYSTCGWDVDEQPQPKPVRKPRKKKDRGTGRCVAFSDTNGTCNAVTGFRNADGLYTCQRHGGTYHGPRASTPEAASEEGGHVEQG